MSKYQLYVGDEGNIVSLWVRGEDNTYPIYANTQETGVWLEHDPEAEDNPENTDLSDAFLEHLSHIHKGIAGIYEDHTHKIASRPSAEPKAYEKEILNAIKDGEMLPEQELLVEWAYLIEEQ